MYSSQFQSAKIQVRFTLELLLRIAGRGFSIFCGPVALADPW